MNNGMKSICCYKPIRERRGIKTTDANKTKMVLGCSFADNDGRLLEHAGDDCIQVRGNENRQLREHQVLGAIMRIVDDHGQATLHGNTNFYQGAGIIIGQHSTTFALAQ